MSMKRQAQQNVPVLLSLEFDKSESLQIQLCSNDTDALTNWLISLQFVKGREGQSFTKADVENELTSLFLTEQKSETEEIDNEFGEFTVLGEPLVQQEPLDDQAIDELDKEDEAEEKSEESEHVADATSAVAENTDRIEIAVQSSPTTTTASSAALSFSPLPSEAATLRSRASDEKALGRWLQYILGYELDTDMYKTMSSVQHLTRFVECVTHSQIAAEETQASGTALKVARIQQALAHLAANTELTLPPVSVSSFLRREHKAIADLVWRAFVAYELTLIREGSLRGVAALFAWTRRCRGRDSDVSVGRAHEQLLADFSDGRALCELMVAADERSHGGTNVDDLLLRNGLVDTIEHCLRLGEQSLRVPALIDADEFVGGAPSAVALIAHLTLVWSGAKGLWLSDEVPM